MIAGLFMYWGENKKFKITIVDAETKEPLPLTNHVITVTLRRHIDDVDPALVKATNSGVTHRNQTTEPGVADLQFDVVDTKGPPLEMAMHNLDVWIDDKVIWGPGPFEIRKPVRR